MLYQYDNRVNSRLIIRIRYNRCVHTENPTISSFFQSKEFAEFQDKIPYRGKTWLLKYHDQDLCLVIRQKLRFGKCWLWVPYGPLGFSEEIFEDLARIAKEEKAIFARIEPPSKFLPGEEFDFLKSRWRIVKSKQRFTPEHSLILDLEKTEDEILAQMKPKGRYNILTAKRHNVLIQQYNSNISEKDFGAFYKILQKTGSRDGFGIHPKYFYKTLLEVLAPKKMASLFLAHHQNAVIGGIIVVFYKDTATYYYGASSYEHRSLMAPYLLQWEAIREAKRRGMKYYDFLGIAPPGEENHPYAGITEFKKKFGGREVIYPPAFDIIYKPIWYRAAVKL